MDYNIDALIKGSVRPRGFINAVLNDLGIMAKADGTYGQLNGWTGGGTIKDFLTDEQIRRYHERVEPCYRRITRLTVVGCQRPPRAVGRRRSFKRRAIS